MLLTAAHEEICKEFIGAYNDGNTQMKWKQVYWSTETIAKFMEINFFFWENVFPTENSQSKAFFSFHSLHISTCPTNVCQPQSLKLARTSGFSLIALSLVERL
ncbi:hypothetical protein CMV_027756 [Castanea mollissima]|uniref:Uncharacterized protein n=1 Tax=Castanea mollissima TaxID=60419 RepID=A0A8J4Q8X2_9ROSI|nr:hypothetical protein CMV_027756 [Castanea mollissima]